MATSRRHKRFRSLTVTENVAKSQSLLSLTVNRECMCTVVVLCDRVGSVGGAERYWETVVPAIVGRGVRIRLLAREVDDPERFGIDAVSVRWGAENEEPCAEAAATIARELERERPDAVITASVFDTGVLDAIRASGIPWIAKLHDHRVFCPTGDRVYPQFSRICSDPMGSACRVATLVHGCVRGPRPASLAGIAARERVRDRITTAHRIIVSSEHMRQTCIANGVAPERIAILPPPLPDAAFAQSVAPRPKQSTLVFASRLTPRKGLRSLLAALSRLARAERPRLVVAGSGDGEERAARAHAAQSGLDVEWRGQLSADALRDAIDAATAVAVPSMWPEPFGLVGIEAQARGRPAVAYRVGGIADWITDAGIAVPRGDENALALAIRAILDEHTWSPLAACARRRAEAYRLDAHVDRFLNLCNAA